MFVDVSLRHKKLLIIYRRVGSKEKLFLVRKITLSSRKAVLECFFEQPYSIKTKLRFLS